MAREAQLKEYEIQTAMERRAREVREHELEVQQKIAAEEEARRTEALAASRRIEHERKMKIKVDMERENLALA